MKAFLNLYRANLTEFLSNKRALFLTIAFPILFITIFGLVFTNQDKADAKIGLAAADGDDTVARELIDALRDLPKAKIDKDGKPDPKNAEHNPFSELKFIPGERAALLTELRLGHLDAVVTIPGGLADKASDARDRAIKAALAEKRGLDEMADVLSDDGDDDKKSRGCDASRRPPPPRLRLSLPLHPRLPGPMRTATTRSRCRPSRSS